MNKNLIQFTIFDINIISLTEISHKSAFLQGKLKTFSLEFGIEVLLKDLPLLQFFTEHEGIFFFN